MTALYRIKTSIGYYFAKNGYGRTTGTQQEATLMCQDCANRLLAVFYDAGDGYAPEVEAVERDNDAHCQMCERYGRTW